LEKRAAIGTVVAGFLAIGLGTFVVLSKQTYLPAGNVPPTHPSWIEVQWPFPTDQWGRGKTFQCKAADCGTLVNLYIRPKLGSCNCTTGVADDGDLDRMSDLDLLGGEVSPLGDGRPVSIGWMKGRSRIYTLPAHARDKSAISIVLNDRCDMIVATVVVPADSPATVEPSVMEFLNSESVLNWAELELGI
jgi:hypothetical protein